MLGAKRNAACELPAATLIAHWDDDDWPAPHRLRYQLEQLGDGAEVVRRLASCCTSTPPSRALALHLRRPRAPWVAGNTLLYTKRDAWRSGRSPRDRRRRGLALPRRPPPARTSCATTGSSSASIHAANASPKRTDNAWWRRIPVTEIERVLGADAAVYLPGTSRVGSVGRTGLQWVRRLTGAS